MNFQDKGLNDGSVERWKAIDYKIDGFEKSASVDLNRSLMSTFILITKIHNALASKWRMTRIWEQKFLIQCYMVSNIGTYEIFPHLPGWIEAYW